MPRRGSRSRLGRLLANVRQRLPTFPDGNWRTQLDRLYCGSPVRSIVRQTSKEEHIMRHNRLRALLTADQPSLGTHLLSSWPTLVELVGDAGNYDYVEFTAEYAPFHMHDLDNLGRALELKNLGGMIKIEQTQWTHQAMRAIGSGFQAVLFADLRTVEDAHA